MRMLNWAVLTASALAVVAPVAAQDWTWRGQVSAGQWLEIKGVNGSIRAQPSSSNQIEVEAVKRAERSDPDEVKIEVVQGRGGVTICAIYPAPENKQANECTQGERWNSNSRNNDVRVDFVVRVPRGTQVDARTVNGSVTMAGMTADVSAHTVNGSVRIATTGLAEAATVNGSINVSMGRADWDDILEFTTVNGEITLELAGDVNTEVRATTVSGSIATDYPLTLRGRFGQKRITGTIGRGGRELSLTTVNGDIEIRKKM
jgi:Toastrack DUF4097